MKILFATDDFPPLTHSGPSIVAYNLAQGLIKSGHEIEVITCVGQRHQAGSETYDGIKIHRIFSNYPQRFKNYFSLYNPQIISQFQKLIAAINPDVCHFHNVHDCLSYHCFKLGRRHSRAVFLTAHDMMLISHGKLMPKNGSCNYKVNWREDLIRAKKRYNPFRNLTIRHYLKYVDRIFCISKAQQKILATNGITNTVTVHNAINLDEWRVDPAFSQEFRKKFCLFDKKIIMFGGRLSIAKGGDAIFAAMAKVAEVVPDAILMVVGEVNDYAKELMAKAGSLGLAGRVIFAGWLSREKIMQAFFSADVCVTPSIYFDPFNLFNIEAMAAGRPVVGTCFGGTPEIIRDGVTGYVVNPLQTEKFAGRIIDLLDNQARAEQFGRAGRQRVEKEFSVAGQVQATLAWYNKFLRS